MTLAMPSLNRLPAAERGITIGDFLVPIRVGEQISSRARHVILILFGTAFVALCAQIYIPAEPVPFTGQTLGVLLVGGALGFRRAAVAMLLYLALGAVGLPIYAQAHSGTGVLLGPTGGYIVGFVLAAALVGRLAELGWDRRIIGAIGAMLLGNVVIYAIGVPWLMATRNLSLQAGIAAGLTPFLLWDALKLIVAAGLFPVAWWIVGRRPGER
jgi:biotin transport system substrate-specific component